MRLSILLSILFALFFLCSAFMFATAAEPFTGQPCHRSSFSRLPLYFIENQGQTDPEVRYYVKGADKTLYFTPDGVTYDLRGAGESKAQRWVVKLDFIEASPDASLKGRDKHDGTFSFFKGKKDQWRTDVPSYTRLVYEDLWPGIDLVYCGEADRLKYQFEVAPGADPERIRLCYRGAEKVDLTPEGGLKVCTPLGDFEDQSPVSFQEGQGERESIATRYVLDPCLEPGVQNYRFELDSYDPARVLILDPSVFIYAGYIGGEGNDYKGDVAVDAQGNAYVVGYTTSEEYTFPVIVGPDLTHNWGYNGVDAFVAKVDPQGTGLIYCGYIGGAESDWGTGIDVDTEGNAYVTGGTESDEYTFPVTIGPDLTFNGGWEGRDAFVARVSAAGTHLDYCGYIGGSFDDEGNGIGVDADGCAYITGITESPDLPVLVGPDLTFNGDEDAFIAKVSPSGVDLQYCGYIGGEQRDRGFGIALDEFSHAYITGYTYSSELTFPVVVGPDLSHNGGYDVYVAKVDATGTWLHYSGFIGGSNYDYGGQDIAVDSEGCAYVVGYTYSSDFPVKVGPDLSYNGSKDAIIAKVNAYGTDLVYSGFIGGIQLDTALGVAVDGDGCAYVTGDTDSDELTFPVKGGPSFMYPDSYLAKVSLLGTHLDFCGYLCGCDEASKVALDPWGNIYVTGHTESSYVFPAVVGPDLTHNGDDDVFVLKVPRIWFVDDNNIAGPWIGSEEKPFKSIQQGIDTAAEGQWILVKPGTYHENLDFMGKAVTVLGDRDGQWGTHDPAPQETVIDGDQMQRVVTIHTVPFPGAVLGGFTITNGLASDYGGGILCHDSMAVLANNIVCNNQAVTYGGGGIICSESSDLVMVNNMVHGNYTDGSGGGILCVNAAPVMTNNTLYGNTAAVVGGGICVDNQSFPKITNTILWANTAAGGQQVYDGSGGTVLTFCNVQGGWPGTGNFKADPLFEDAASGDLHLTLDSPCMDAGDDEGSELPQIDFEGHPRLCYDHVDVGADEICGGYLYQVPADYSTIQAAVDAAQYLDVVLVAPGTYFENIVIDSKSIIVRSDADGDPGTHDIAPELTIIDGNQAGRVVFFDGYGGSETLFEGFTITNGLADYGAGLHCNSDPTILHNIITNNHATSGGGGIYGGNAKIFANIISNNSTYDMGGGILSSTKTQTLIKGNVLWGNDAWRGGGIFCNGSNPQIVNNTLYGNTALYGGGLGVGFDAWPHVSNIILWNNQSTSPGKEIYIGFFPGIAYLTIDYSLVQGGLENVYVDYESKLYWGDCMLEHDPQFVNAEINDFHLTWGSPCINRGTNDGVFSQDLDGDLVPYMGTADMGYDEFTGTHRLSADAFELSEAAGGVIRFDLFGGAENAGRAYLIFGSISGTIPGFYLPGGRTVVPLNKDYVTSVIMLYKNTPLFQNFMGHLNPIGQATAELNTNGPMPPGASGLTLYFAFCLGAPWEFASNPVAVEIKP